jgi:hypothetical protein
MQPDSYLFNVNTEISKFSIVETGKRTFTVEFYLFCFKYGK